MPALFLSHASEDDKATNALEAWLRANGFTDIFVDHHSLVGGEKWWKALRASAGACRVVVCLVSESWLASHECFIEFRVAWSMGKRIIPLFMLSTGSSRSAEASARLMHVCTEDQGIDLAGCFDANGTLELDAHSETANRLKLGLHAAGAISRIGLDPQAFSVDARLRPTPFPGLASFGDDDADAALFYGRSREIAETLEELRKVRAERDLRPFVILGASGAGKSSLLKAGIIPRLRREAPAWLPLRAFRPGADPLLNFAEALSRTLADFGKIEAYGLIRDRLLETWSAVERTNGELSVAGLARLETAIEAEGRKLREAAGRPDASILISVDQAEELARANGSSADALADYLRLALASARSGWQLAFTIRTDSLAELQGHRRFQDLRARGYDLRAIPVVRFDAVVEGPAKRYGVEVDNVLVDALMEDAPKEDSLPLLAFALQRLWRQYAASGALTKDNYEKVGGLSGLIEDASERALRGIEPEQDVPLPATPPPKRLVELGASTFVPALAQLNEHGAPMRRMVPWTAFDDEQRALLERFDRWRLVVRKGEADGGTVEVAHEALFREWTRLKSWLEPERARLDALRLLQVGALAWDRNARDASFLNHRGRRLAEADVLIGVERYKQQLGKIDLGYLSACRVAEQGARRRRLGARALMGVLAAAAVLEFAMYWKNSVRQAYHSMAHVSGHVLTVAEEQMLKPRTSFLECVRTEEDYSGHCPEMVVLPAGKFLMGSPISEDGHFFDEGPVHEVTIAQPFAVSKFEVTFDQWDACVRYGACTPVSDSPWGRGRQPVIFISWRAALCAMAFAADRPPVSAADRGRMGICGARRDSGPVFLRRRSRCARHLCLVRQQFRGQAAPGGRKKAQLIRTSRHARQRLGMGR
jgi:hypothetical protein